MTIRGLFSIVLTASCLIPLESQAQIQGPSPFGEATSEPQPLQEAPPQPGFGAAPQSPAAISGIQPGYSSNTQPSLPLHSSQPSQYVQQQPSITPHRHASSPTHVLFRDDEIAVTYVTVTTVKEQTGKKGADGQMIEREVVRHKQEELVVKGDVELSGVELPVDAKRVFVLTVTAKRHEKLLASLKKASTEEEKEKATAALKENYEEHYAIETWWRERKLKKLEDQLTELRSQVKQRTESQEKYVGAAMTIAELHADGLAIAPPKPTAPASFITGSPLPAPSYGTPSISPNTELSFPRPQRATRVN